MAEKSKRVFGLPEAIIYRPTPEEFSRPLEYIKKITPEASLYGICKIIPPSDFCPPFSLDSSRFQFKTRFQNIHSLDGASRQRVNYVEKLKKFWKQLNIDFEPPMDGSNVIDLLKLKNSMEKNQLLHGNQKILKSCYRKWIVPYENFVKSNGKLKALNGPDDELDSDSSSEDSNDDESIKSDQLSDTESESDSIEEHRVDTRSRTSAKQSPKRSERLKRRLSTPIISEPKRMRNVTAKKHLPVGTETCLTCDQKDGKLIVCDKCKSSFHLKCIDLSEAPMDNWFCVSCIKTIGTDYGFEERVKARNLEEFKIYAESFKRNHFLKNVSETEIEKEFWRLTFDFGSNINVEYGADLHSSVHGSGFPTIKNNPRNAYAKHPWNLNNLSIDPDSLLRFINTDISGMMVPWLYVGMVFSTFCWHIEDHYTFSINYHHWGDTKTWYGVPESDADKFEETMKEEVPELFEANPDLLHHLTTILSPEVLVKNNVKVFALDQRPGDFIITFPRAYHSGFNHGINCCEAVNFAPTDWLPYGEQSLENYAKFKKAPVFCHEELLMNTVKKNHDPSTSKQYFLLISLENALRRMKKMEIDQRKLLPKSLKVAKTRKAGDACTQCRAFCFYSKVVCDKHPAIVSCLRHHVGKMCECDIKHKSLAVNVDEEEFDFYIEKMSRMHQISQFDGTDDAREWEDESLKKGRPTMNGEKAVTQINDVIYQPDIPDPSISYKKPLQYKPLNFEYHAAAIPASDLEYAGFQPNIPDHLENLKSKPTIIQKPKKISENLSSIDWVSKLSSICTPTPEMSLKEYHQLLKSTKEPQVQKDLQLFIEECKEWASEASKILRQNRRKSRIDHQENVLTIADVKLIIDRGKHLPFKSPEMDMLLEKCREHDSINEAARKLFDDGTDADVKKLEDRASVLGIEVEGVKELWIKRDNHGYILKYGHLKDFCEFSLDELQKIEKSISAISNSHSLLTIIRRDLFKGQKWLNSANSLLQFPGNDLDEIEKLLQESKYLPHDPEIARRLEFILSTTQILKEFLDRKNSHLKNLEELAALPADSPEKIEKLIMHSKKFGNSVQGLIEFSEDYEYSKRWKARLQKVFNGKISMEIPLSEWILDFERIIGCSTEDRNYICICYTENNSLKVRCAKCDNIYHRDCLKLCNIQPQFVCPCCNVTEKFQPYLKPSLDALISATLDCPKLIRLPEVSRMANLLLKLTTWLSHITKDIDSLSEEDLRHILKKLYSLCVSCRESHELEKILLSKFGKSFNCCCHINGKIRTECSKCSTPFLIQCKTLHEGHSFSRNFRCENCGNIATLRLSQSNRSPAKIYPRVGSDGDNYILRYALPKLQNSSDPNFVRFESEENDWKRRLFKDEKQSIKIDNEYIPIAHKVHYSRGDMVYGKSTKAVNEQESSDCKPAIAFMIDQDSVYRPENIPKNEVSVNEYEQEPVYRGLVIEPSRKKYNSTSVSYQLPNGDRRSSMMVNREYKSLMMQHHSPMIESKIVYPPQDYLNKQRTEYPQYPKPQLITKVDAWPGSDSYQSEYHRPNREYVRAEYHLNESYQKMSESCYEHTLFRPLKKSPADFVDFQKRTEISFPKESRYSDYYRSSTGQTK